MKTVVIITTGQPSVNPRVVKEADALTTKGFAVTVLFCFWIKWGYDADKSLLQNVKWKFHLVGGAPTENKLLYYFTKARFKINIELNKKFGNRFLFAERAQARCFDELLAKAKSIKADWYVGHNLGALPVAQKAASFHHAKAGFDFEDYHRAENTDVALYKQNRILYLEEKYVCRLSYISTASPLITEMVRRDFPAFSKPLTTILNCFPLITQPSVSNEAADNKTLQLFWFSQTIGRNRGLELVVQALRELNNPSIHLTLAGRCDKEMADFINANSGVIKDCIRFAGIIEPDKLPSFASGFDVGLATEIATPFNRNICLTNKIFTYLVAGICVLASNTDAQEEFMTDYPGIGLTYKNDDLDSLADSIRLLNNERAFLNQCKENVVELAKTRMNWEVESKQLINTLLNK